MFLPQTQTSCFLIKRFLAYEALELITQSYAPSKSSTVEAQR